MKYPNRAIQCTKFLTITIQDKVCYKACNATNFMKLTHKNYRCK